MARRFRLLVLLGLVSNIAVAAAAASTISALQDQVAQVEQRNRETLSVLLSIGGSTVGFARNASGQIDDLDSRVSSLFRRVEGIESSDLSRRMRQVEGRLDDVEIGLSRLRR